MNIKEVLYSQYDASLAMLKNVINSADEEIWYQSNENHPPYWHILYHVLFCTDCYLYKDLQTFKAWQKHKKDYQFLGKSPFPPFEKPNISEPYSKEDILEYFENIHNTLAERINTSDLEAESGFYWVPVNKLELHIYNIRHIQHHAGQLAYLLRSQKNIGINWIVKGETEEV